jgi:polyferredoxin
MGILAFMSIAFGAVFCGWICPLGTFQEWLGKLGKRLFGRKYNTFIPQKADKYLRYIRYIVLAWVIYITAVTGKLVFSDIDPYHALFNFWSGEVTLQAFVLLGVIAITALIIERPWCKYACPLGALLGIFNSFRIFKIRRNENRCISCGKCNSACPMGIKVMEGKVVKNHQCISCLECTSDLSCPVANTVELSLGGGNEDAIQG